MAKKATIRGHKPPVVIPVEPEVNESLTAPLDPVIVEGAPDASAPSGDTPPAEGSVSSTVSVEPFARDQVSDVEEFTTDEHGRYVATSLKFRELFVRIGGTRYEHTAETPDGRWIFAKS